MDGSTAFMSTMIFSFLMLTSLAIMHLGRGPIGKFLDKISPFPFLREGGNYKYKNFNDEITIEGQVLWALFYLIFIGASLFLSFGVHWFTLGVIFAVVFPCVLIIIRRDIFGDNKIVLDTEIDYNISEIFMKSFCGSIGFLFFFITVFWDQSLIFPIIILILVLIPASVPFFLDYIIKKLPYDFNTKKGKLYFDIITLIPITIEYAFIVIVFKYY